MNNTFHHTAVDDIQKINIHDQVLDILVIVRMMITG